MRERSRTVSPEEKVFLQWTRDSVTRAILKMGLCTVRERESLIWKMETSMKGS